MKSSSEKIASERRIFSVIWMYGENGMIFERIRMTVWLNERLKTVMRIVKIARSHDVKIFWANDFSLFFGLFFSIPGIVQTKRRFKIIVMIKRVVMKNSSK